MIVTAVVLPAERSGVGELLFLDKVDPAQFGRIHVQLNRQHLDHAFDEVHGLRHPERTAIADAARGLVGVDAVYLEVSSGDVIRPCADIHEPCRKFGRIRTGIKATMIRRHMAVQTSDLAFFGRADLARHVVVAGKGGGHQVVHPVFNPLDRLARHNRRDNRADISRIRAHLVAKAAADIGRDHSDVVFLNARDQRDNRPDRMRRLERAPKRQLSVHLVHRRHTPAGLKRAGVRAVVIHAFRRHDVGIRDHFLRRVLVARLPRKDMVVMLARPVRTSGDGAVLGHQILAQHDVRLQRLERIDDHGQLVVLHLDRLNPVRRRVAILGHNKRHFLPLEQHFAIRKHHLLVTRQRRHPVQAQRLQICRRQHGQHAGNFQRRRRINAFDPGMRIRRAHKVAKDHSVELDIIDVVALALGETRILNPLARAAHAFEVRDAIFAVFHFVFHSAASLAAFISAAAA